MRNRSFAASIQATVHPSARSHAAADASPNGCRPISKVLIRSACTPCIVDSAHAFTPTSAGPLRPLLHRALGALQLLLDDGDPVALHERGVAFRRRACGAC